MLRVPSSDDVSVAVHDLAGTIGQPVVLIAHATGFHGRAYLPVAASLAHRFHVLAADLRGHGDTDLPPGWQVDWHGYGDDALAVAEALVALSEVDDGLIGFGHSMGGVALLMAAQRAPELFRLLVLFEPIVGPPWPRPGGIVENPLIAGARRRRATFHSIDAAIANYASKPPLSDFDPAALDAYVRYGVRRDPVGHGVRLKCEPEHEARTFEEGGNHDTWDRLPTIEIPVVVVSGVVEEHQASRFAEAVADELPHGRFVLDTDLDHFGPFTHPARVAEIVEAADAETFLHLDRPPGRPI
jgi:pimeloyl-ACP methyl ester carboxylesterase